MIKIIAVGDIMPGGILNKTKDIFVSETVADYLKNADFRIGTLECGIGNEPIFCPIKRGKGSSAFVYAEDDDLKRLLTLNINAVSLANNHFFDLGEIGAKHTIRLLNKYGISYFGAGMNLKEAQEPAVFNISGKTIAFVGFCDTTIPFCQIATETTAGINPLEEKNIYELVKTSKSKYDYVFAVIHWGKEHTWWPRPHVKRYAQILQNAGISGIIGNHPHRVQSVCKIKGCPVAFSLGNFLFPDRVINTPYVTYYPSNIDSIKKMKSVYGFTRVQEPSLKLWPDIANIGMILNVTCDNNSTIAMNYKLTQITHSGFIDFKQDSQRIEKILNLSRLVISSCLYSTILCTYEWSIKIFKKCISKFKRIIKSLLQFICQF